MTFHNHLIETPQPTVPTATVPFNQLKKGDRYTLVSGKVEVVIRKEFQFLTSRRVDGWLVTSHEGDWVWDRLVSVLTK